MNKLADFVQDRSGRWLHAMSKVVDLPEFVKSADAPAPEDVAALPSRAFAHPTVRQFPIHTKAATYLSCLSYLDQASGMDAESKRLLGARLNKAADFWRIRTETDALATKLASRDADVPQANDDYAMVVEVNGAVERLLPVNTPQNVSAAAESLRTSSHCYPRPWRKSAAERILRKAANLNVPLPSADSDFLHRAAGLEPAHPVDIAQAIVKRANCMPAHAAADSIRVLAAAQTIQESFTEPDEALSEKMAGWMDELDDLYGLHGLYFQHIPTPDQACFTQMSKFASALQSNLTTLANGAYYSTRDLANVDPAVYAVIRKDLPEELSDSTGSGLDMDKVADLLPRLPARDAERLTSILKVAGVDDKRAKWGTYGEMFQRSKSEFMEMGRDLGFEPEERDFKLTWKLSGANTVGYGGIIARQQAAAILADEGQYATSLMALLIDVYGTEFFEWEPDTLIDEVSADFNVRLPAISRDRIWAAVTCLTTDQIYRTAEAFSAIANAFNGDLAGFAIHSPPDAAEAAWGLAEASLLMGEDYKTDLFQPEVRAFVGVLLQEAGIRGRPVPRVLDIADLADASVYEDPMITSVQYSRQQEAIEDITSYVRARLGELFKQLSMLPIQQAAADWKADIQQILSQMGGTPVATSTTG